MDDLLMPCGHGDFWSYGFASCAICDEWRWRLLFMASQITVACLLARLESYGWYLPTEGIGTEWIADIDFPDVESTPLR